MRNSANFGLNKKDIISGYNPFKVDHVNQPPTVHTTCGKKRKESHDESERDEDIVGNREKKQGEVARVDGVQPPVQGFRSLQTL